MFEVGRTYTVTTREGDETSYTTSTVVEVDMPLVKFSRPGNYIIVNVAAPSFVSAEPNDEKAQADIKAEHERFAGTINRKFIGLTDQPD